ncbi:MAG: nucleotide pyrophosphohydrolase [Patescibacteria group bacterium]
MDSIETLLNKIRAFTNARDWDQYHNPKDLAISLVLEAAEVLEHFQWKNGEELALYLDAQKGEVSDELSDVLVYLLMLSDKLGIDLITAAQKKIRKNEAKYPIEKSKGKNTKYTKL